MPSVRKSELAILFMVAVSPLAHGQASPAAAAATPYSQFSLPDVGGSLRYALTASESILTGYNGTTGRGVSSYTNLSGELGYLSRNPNHPFSAVYAGGYLFGSSPFPSYFYQSLTLSQGFHTKNWDFLVGDAVSYLPQTPIGSLSGVPGAGDLSLQSVQINSAPSLGILTTYSSRVTNTASGTATRRFTASTSLSISGADSLQRYTSSSTAFEGLNNDQQTGSVALQHRLDERTSIGAQYQFTNSTFASTAILGPGSHGYQTHTVQALFSRELSPRLTLVAGVGPQWVVSGSDSGLTSGTSANLAATAALSYQAHHYNAALSYLRAINNGNGVVVGARQDSVVASATRPLGRIYNVGGLVGFNHSEQLGNSTLANFNSSGVIAGGQFSAQLRPSLSAFTSYTLQRQLFNGVSPSGIAFNGLTQYVTFGVTFAPKPIFSRK